MRISGWAIIAIAAVALCSCANRQAIVDRDDFLAEATRTYHGVHQEQVIRAAESILKISDPGDWEFRYTDTGFTGLRRFYVYAIIAAQSGREKWEFGTANVGGAVRASLTISEEGVSAGGYSIQTYEKALNAIPLYRLFWARMDYVLGQRADWKTCEQAEAEAKAANFIPELSGLCGLTSQGRNNIPPRLTERLANENFLPPTQPSPNLTQ